MKKNGLITFFLLTVAALRAQDVEFVYAKTITQVSGVIHLLGKDTEGMVVIVPRDSSQSWRYYASMLPTELKKEGLRVVFSGDVGQIPKNVRMMATPLRLSGIWISKTERKKFKLKKTQWLFLKK